MKFLSKKSVLAAAVSFALPATMVNAKTFHETLANNLAEAPLELHEVIVTFDNEGAVTESQLDAIHALGITGGVSMHSLPVVGVLATKAQVEALYQRDDVVSVWNNDKLELENHEATKLTGVQKLRGDRDIRLNGMPVSGRGIGVVVNDSGVDGTHSDLSYPNHVVQNVLAQVNLRGFSGVLPITYQEGVANTDILGGHGTHVAGTVGGSGMRSDGMHAGVAPGADIIGYGSGAGLFILDTIGGFDYALTNQFTYGIRVISNSFGQTSDVGTDFNPDHPTNVVTKDLADNGIITVFSAGNSGPGESTITGNFKKAPWVITVAAGDKDGNLADFSSRGVDGKGDEVVVDGEVFVWEDRPTITAPGVDIISARASLSSLGALSAQDDADMIAPEQVPFYTVSSGTSMAAPHASGIVALMLEANPNLQWREVKSILQETATPMAGLAEWEAGAGYANAYAAVKAVLDGVEVYGDTVKQNRDFNAFANVTEGDSFSTDVTFLPVGESPAETFEVPEGVSMVIANASIETGTTFVLEDPAGNTYSGGIGLPVLGSSTGTAATGMPGTWKVYMRGIGCIAGACIDPLGVTNGVGVPGTTTVNIRFLETAGFTGIDDAVGHVAQEFIENVVANELMDAKADGFKPDDALTRVELADTLVLSANVRQALKGNEASFNDVDASMAAAVNSVTQKGSVLKDRDMVNEALMTSDGEFFDAAAPVSRAEMAYSMVQALGLQADAEAFDADKVFALFRGEEVEVIDADLIPAELKGYVQQALAMNLMTVEYEVVQKPFSFETETVAKFNPSASISRGEAAFIITQFDTKR